MKRKLLICLFFLGGALITSTQAQTIDCQGLTFAKGTFGRWIGKTGSISNTGSLTLLNTGLIQGRHTMMTPGLDSLVGIATVPPGASHSVRLGNSGGGGQAESLELTFTVTAAQSTFQYQYAVVLEDPGHQAHQQPGLEFKILDAAQQPIPCSVVKFVANENIPGFRSKGYIRYKDWTTVAVDLSPYVGQQITIRFATNDCLLGSHFGYCYLTTSCISQPIQISSYCSNNQGIALSAPSGYAKYNWSNGQTGKSIWVSNPRTGDIYTVTLFSVSGCTTTASLVVPPKLRPIAIRIIANQGHAGSRVLLKVNADIPGKYTWYTSANLREVIVDAVDNTYLTPTLSENTTYYVVFESVQGCRKVMAVEAEVSAPGIESKEAGAQGYTEEVAQIIETKNKQIK